jgi:hypothetical protein
MMKYWLMLILSLLSIAMIRGFDLSNDSPDLNRNFFVHSEVQDSVRCLASIQDDNIRTALNNAWVAAPKDTFPLQVGAFRYKSNAEKISRGMQKISGLRVKIYVENGLYKVRITQLPSSVRNKESVITEPASASVNIDTVKRRSLSDKILLAQLTSDASDTIIDPKTHITRAQTESSEVIGDTASASTGKSFKDNSPWLKRIKYFGESFALVNALIITILICIATMITLLIVILLNRRRMENEARLRQYLMEKYQSLIVDYLYGSATPEEFRAIASDNYSRQVLIDQMIDVSVNLKGEESKRLFSLYKHLGLDRDSLARARDFRWHKKIKGFRELAFMNIKTANDAIHKALNSSNEILRMEAQIALVRLSDDNHFEFLSHLKRPFSLWEQITLHDLIIQHNIPVPAFKKWLSSPNDTVVLFALRMIREFKQYDAEENIKTTLHHIDPLVRLMAVQVAGDLQLTSTLEILKRMYKNQDYKTCLEIVRSMGKMPDPSMMGFLKLVLDKEDDVQLQIEATKSIERMGEEGVKALVKIMKSEYKNYNIIVRHVLDRRIN